MVITVSQSWKQKHQDAEKLVPSHKANAQQSWGLSSLAHRELVQKVTLGRASSIGPPRETRVREATEDHILIRPSNLAKENTFMA